jgi:hypothetical protein
MMDDNIELGFQDTEFVVGAEGGISNENDAVDTR